jgi:hypothetical protein
MNLPHSLNSVTFKSKENLLNLEQIFKEDVTTVVVVCLAPNLQLFIVELLSNGFNC